MNKEQNAESKLEHFKQKISVIISATNTSGNQKRDVIMEAAKEYWQSIATPAGNEVNVKEVAVDFMWENERPDIATKGYLDFIQLFDEWFSNNKYYQNKISKPHTVEEAAKEESEIEELREEAQDLLIKIAPPETFGEDADCERLYNIIDELAKAASLPQSSTEEECQHPFAFVQTRCMGEINHCLKCGKNL